MLNNYTCLVAEDNLLDRDAIEMFLSKIENLSIAAVCSSGLEAASVLSQKEIDIVFTDIDMPGLTGIELIQSLSNPPVFVFISAYSEHAAESYNLDVIDFVMKPVSLPRLIKAAHKAIEYIELKKKVAAGGTDNSIHLPPPNPGNDHFFIKENADYCRIDTANLIYIESMGNFCKLYTLQKKHITLVSLKNMEQQLSADFLRVHKQYIINLQHMTALSSEGKVQLTNGQYIPVGDMYKEALLDIIHKKAMVR